MNIQLKRSTSLVELLQIVKKMYPSAKIFVEKTWIRIIIENYPYLLVLTEKNELRIAFVTLWPSNEKKILAQEMTLKIADTIENGIVDQEVGNLVPTTCPHCKSPNEKKALICEWCGGKVI
jgi:hypothetical protein